MAELARVGFPGLTIEGVARAANVNSTTIYRRWPSKGALLLAVIEPLLERFDRDPDIGSLDGDLLSLMLLTRPALRPVRPEPSRSPMRATTMPT
jgi:AcrR family transcriptional regulator